MSEVKFDTVRISKEAAAKKPSGATPAWISPILKRYYDVLKRFAGLFNKELQKDREEEFIKAVSKSFKEEV